MTFSHTILRLKDTRIFSIHVFPATDLYRPSSQKNAIQGVFCNFKKLPWVAIETGGSKLSYYQNIFLS